MGIADAAANHRQRWASVEHVEVDGRVEELAVDALELLSGGALERVGGDAVDVAEPAAGGLVQEASASASKESRSVPATRRRWEAIGDGVRLSPR